ncbi:hypothetical protein N1851_019610 [Merluccius polli]|uniref:Uncharacterized protein n=1 Tax=Merluccius polli TaxID=89951 RepID=A0AA47MLX2_MERPO|nr:hypothetical protein N1851_019610 [Merluccius polli]
MEDELDMDELYNENCVLQDVLRNLEINSHSVGELWAQALRSRVGLVLDEESASCSSREAEDSECSGSAAGRDSSD